MPAKEVGGDFYDIFSKNESEIYFSIADAAGKGVSACLYSLGLRSMLRFAIASGTLEENRPKGQSPFLHGCGGYRHVLDSLDRYL